MSSSAKRWNEAAAVVLVVVALGACSASPDAEKSKETESAATVEQRGAASEFIPVDSDSFPNQPLRPLDASVTRPRVVEASGAGDAARAGERFAILAAQYFTDARGSAITNADVSDLVRASDQVRNYIVTDQAQQVQSKSKRHLDPSVSGWVKSAWVGDSASGRVLRVQWLAYLHGDVGDEVVEFWVNFRVDVRQQDGHWVVTDYVNGAGPSAKEPTKEDLDRYFDGGKGWRRIPSA